MIDAKGFNGLAISNICFSQKRLKKLSTPPYMGIAQYKCHKWVYLP